MTKTVHDPTRAPRRDWRHVHHSPWFWIGVAMFMAAILTYVFSEDLSLTPRRHGSLETDSHRARSFAMVYEPSNAGDFARKFVCSHGPTETAVARQISRAL